MICQLSKTLDNQRVGRKQSDNELSENRWQTLRSIIGSNNKNND